MNPARSNVLINPDRFFSELSEREVNLTTPVEIVLIWAITDAIYAVIVGALLIRNFPNEAISSGIVIAVLVIQAIVMGVVVGFIWAVLFYTHFSVMHWYITQKVSRWHDIFHSQ